MEELETTVNETVETDSSEIAKLRADLAKQKAALDKATKEAGDYKKQLRARQSEDEAAQEEAKALRQSMQEELETLRKEKAVASITTKVMAKFSTDDSTSANVAEYLYGADNADAALELLSKAWTAREKALRLEFGKIPAPGAGSGDGPAMTKAELDGLNYMERLKFATDHPDEYNKLMGR